ncbi:hypothetical protein AKJ16_DCAP08198 [Drosera capensis]
MELVQGPVEEVMNFGFGSLFSEVQIGEDFLEKATSVNDLAGIWWAIHEAARYCTAARLRTNLGGPSQTFAALERMLMDVVHVLELDAGQGADGVQFVITCLIESYTAICDWKSLESWLSELQALRAKHAGKSYSGALTTAGNEMNAIHALSHFDEGDLQTSWASLDLTPKSSCELTLDPRLALQRSEKMLLQAMLYYNEGKMDNIQLEIHKSKLMLDEVLTVLPLHALDEAAPHAMQSHCIFALEESCKYGGTKDKMKKSTYLLNSFLHEETHFFSPLGHDCNALMKIFRVYRSVLPSSLATLELCKNTMRLARKHGNLGLANRLHGYLKDHRVVDVIEAAAGLPGAEDVSCESLSATVASQLRMIFQDSSFDVQKEDSILSSSLNGLVEIWWSLRKRRVLLFEHAAFGFMQYLSYSTSRSDSGHSTSSARTAFSGMSRSLTLRATLYILHIFLNYGAELKDTLEPYLLSVPSLAWQLKLHLTLVQDVQLMIRELGNACERTSTTAEGQLERSMNWACGVSSACSVGGGSHSSRIPPWFHEHLKTRQQLLLEARENAADIMNICLAIWSLKREEMAFFVPQVI